MIPMIVRVWYESGTEWSATHVPVTPQTSCRDMLECCKEPGDEPCLLFSVHPQHGVHVLRESDLPLEVVSALGPDVQFVLKYVDTETGSTDKSNGMKEPGSPEELLGEGVELTLGELRAMALRQQQQIDTQHQLLCAKEQRLRYLKQQEARQHQVAVEGERLRRLRERVEAQELKLRRLRALRGQLDRNKQANIALTSDLESIRALFNEKEKELSVAVAKVEELTRQLEELRRGRAQPAPPPAHELDKLRRELMYRNKLNEQQNGRLSAQRAALGARQEEMRSIDRRVSELQARLLRKRALNRQLAAAHRHQPQQRTNNPTPMQQLPNHPTGGSNGVSSQPKNQQPRGNIAAVEPYNHVPHAQSLSHNQNFQALKQNVLQNNVPLKQLTQPDNIQSHLTQQEAHYLQQKQMINPLYNGAYPHLPPGVQDSQFQGHYPSKHGDINTFSHVQQGISNQYEQKTMFDHINKYPDYPKQPQYSPNSTSSSKSNQTGKELKINEQEFLPEFAASKSDPKYQTLPYNTKFPQNAKLKPESNTKSNSEQSQESKNQNQNGANINVNHMTVHSTPLSIINKSLATPLSQTEAAYQQEPTTYQLQKSDSSSRCNQEGKENHAYPNNRLSQSNSNESSKNGGKNLQGNAMKGSSPSLGANSTSNNSSMGFGKPVSSVAPTSVQVSSGRPSPIYQTSSTKIQPVQPQTVQTQSIIVQPSSHVTPVNPLVVSQSQIVRNTASGLSSSGSNFGTQNLSSQSVLLSPPQSASTPLSTPDVSVDKSPKPALPPKPTIKTPPRQSANNDPNFVQAKDHETALPTIPIPDTSNDDPTQKETNGNSSNEMIIKARPLTIRKPPLSEQPKLRNLNSTKNGISVSINRRIEMPPAFLFPEMDHLTREAPSEIQQNGLKQKEPKQKDEVDKALLNNNVSIERQEDSKDNVTDIVEQINSVELNGTDRQGSENIVRRSAKGALKGSGKAPLARRVSFDPLALLLDASLEGELELVKKTATQVQNASAANDEGITALHNAICAGHFEIVKFLVELGCDVNAQDSDGWTPLHCAASCNNLPMVRFLVDNGACIFATTLSDHETAAEKCEEDEEGFDGCSEYLYSVQEKLGIMNGGTVYSVFAYNAARSDEITFETGTRLQVLRKGDDSEREWWWCRLDEREGYVPRNLLGLYPRVTPQQE